MRARIALSILLLVAEVNMFPDDHIPAAAWRIPIGKPPANTGLLRPRWLDNPEFGNSNVS